MGNWKGPIYITEGSSHETSGPIYHNGAGTLNINMTWAINKAQTLTIGSSSSTYGSGYALTSTYTKAFGIYADDNNTLLGASAVRAGVFRTLVTISHSNETSIFGCQNQLKIKAPLDCTLTTGNRAGSWNYLEMAGTSTKTLTLSGSAKCTAGCFGMVEWDGVGSLTLSSGHNLAAFAALTNVTSSGGTFTQTGKFSAFTAMNNATASYTKFAWGLYLPVAAVAAGVCVGDFASSYATGSGIPFSSSVTTINRFYGETTSDLTSAYNTRVILGRHLVVTSSATVNNETYGVTGQLCVKNTTLGHLHAGVTGTLEISTAATVNAAYAWGAACVMARLGGGTSILTSTNGVAGFSAVYNGEALASGSSAGFVTTRTGSTNWTYGIYIPNATATVGALFGSFASSAATTGGIPFGTAQNIWSDGQLSTVEAHGASSSDLTSAYSAKVGRFRHIVNVGASGALAHETYGLMGQLVVKQTTLQHLHSGLIGTFEGHTSGVVLNSTYTTGGHSAVMARVGGHAAITCTTPLYGFLAWNNASATVASGTLAAFGTAVASASYQWPIGLYIPSGSCTLPIDVTSSVMGAAGRIAKLFGSCAAGNMTDGYGAVETDLTLTGTVAGVVAASSTWITMAASSSGGGQLVCVRNDGIYVSATGTPMSASTAIIGGRFHYVADGGGNPGALYLFSTNIYDNAITAIFHVNAAVDFAWVTGALSGTVGRIPLFRDVSAGVTWYVNVYSS